MKKNLPLANLLVFLNRYFKSVKILPVIKKIGEMIKKFFKSYFCFWVNSVNIIMSHFMLFMVLCIISGLIFEVSETAPFVFIKVSFFITLGHLILSSIIWKIYIVTPSKTEDEVFCEILVLEDGKAVILDKPIWGSGTKYVIKKFEFTEENATFKFKFEKLHGDSVLLIPVTLTLNLKGKFDKLELFEILSKSQNGAKSLDLRDYINTLFVIDPKLDITCREYVSQKISSINLLNIVINSITFPEKPFSNISGVNIYLDAPTSYAKK